MQKLVWQNANGDSIDLTSGNYGITQWEGFSNTSLNIQSQQVPFQDGAVFLDALLNQRELSVTLKMQDNGNLEERYRMRRELIHILNPKLGEGYLIYTNDFISKRIKCVAQVPLFETHNSDTRGTPKASLAWTACEPYWEDLEEKNAIATNEDLLLIKNEGDVNIQMEITFITNNAKNISIKNEYGKFIKYNGTLTDTLTVNTNAGNKQAVKKRNNMEIINAENGNIAYSEKLNLYLSAYKMLLGSTDLKKWELYNVPDRTGKIVQILWVESKEKFFAFGSYDSTGNQFVIISEDGKNWTFNEIPDSIGYYFSEVVYCEERNEFVATSKSDAYILRSSDGINWSIVYELEGGNFNRITYCDFLHKYFAFSDYDFLTSSDGITWSAMSISSNRMLDIACSDSIVVITTDSNYVLTSTDGINWNQVETPINPVVIIYQSKYKYFIINPNDNSNRILKSKDGTNWNVCITNVANDLLFNMVYIEPTNLLIADGLGSTNGEEWFHYYNLYDYTRPEITMALYVEKYGYFIANGEIGICRTKDFINFTRDSTSLSGDKIAYNKHINIYIAYGSNRVNTSKDTFIWQQVANLTDYFTTYMDSLDLMILGGYSGSQGLIAKSANGVDWTIQNIEGADKILCSCYSEELQLYVVGGNNHKIYTSSDGNNWTLRTNVINNVYIRDIIYDKLRHCFIAVDDRGTQTVFLTSTDGINWSSVSSVTSKINKIILSEYYNTIFAVGGYIASTIDLINWNIMNFCAYNIQVNLLTGFAEGKNGELFALGYGRKCISLSNVDGANAIADIDKISDMNLGLEVGTNIFSFDCTEGNFTVTVKYRQKYLGV